LNSSIKLICPPKTDPDVKLGSDKEEGSNATKKIFDSIVTGASGKGTWVRLLDVPVEGKLVRGFDGADVGDRIRVKLTSLDVQRGYIDFTRIDAAERRR